LRKLNLVLQEKHLGSASVEENKNSPLRRRAVLVIVRVSAHVAFAIPSSKQKGPGLLCEKLASDDGYAATQMGNAYWAVFYSKSGMSQWFGTNS
jgi:hypothetical protein